MKELTTKEKLCQAGKAEFLAKGYKDASLREITKKAGFTLGAFYGYYSNKEALFEEIVKAPAEHLFHHFCKTQADFFALPEQEQPARMEAATQQGLAEMVERIYQDFDVFKLVFFRSAGTTYEGYLQRFIDMEIETTTRFINNLKRQGKALDIDAELVHILSSAMFSGMLEIVDHAMEKERAIRYIFQLEAFYYAGWRRLLGI